MGRTSMPDVCGFVFRNDRRLQKKQWPVLNTFDNVNQHQHFRNNQGHQQKGWPFSCTSFSGYERFTSLLIYHGYTWKYRYGILWYTCMYIYTLHISIGDMYKTYVYIHISNIKVLQNMAQLYLHCIMTSSVRHFWKMNLVDLTTAHDRCALLCTPLPDLAWKRGQGWRKKPSFSNGDVSKSVENLCFVWKIELICSRSYGCFLTIFFCEIVFY